MRLLSLLLIFPWFASAQNFIGNPKDIQDILAAGKAFSQYYIDADYEGMASSYTEDGKIFPSGTAIIEGRAAIRERWVLPEGTKILHHQSTPEEIHVMGDVANDFGYYEGRTKRPDGSISNWKGKYVIVWKRTDGKWKMYLDIWNRVNE